MLARPRPEGGIHALDKAARVCPRSPRSLTEPHPAQPLATSAHGRKFRQHPAIGTMRLLGAVIVRFAHRLRQGDQRVEPAPAASRVGRAPTRCAPMPSRCAEVVRQRTDVEAGGAANMAA